MVIDGAVRCGSTWPVSWAMPKSSSFTRPSLSMTLAGLMSRWTKSDGVRGGEPESDLPSDVQSVGEVERSPAGDRVRQ